MEKMRIQYAVAIASSKKTTFGEENSLRLFQCHATSKEEALGYGMFNNKKELKDNSISLFTVVEMEREVEPRNPNEAMNNEIAEFAINLFTNPGSGLHSDVGEAFNEFMEDISKKYPK